MKKLVISLCIILVFFFSAITLIPIVFKDDIKAVVDAAMMKKVNADILFDADDFSISLLKNFPNATVQMAQFEVINRAPFLGHKLFAANGLEIEVSLFSLFGDKIEISGVKLDSPVINLVVLEDGTANYDIVIATDDKKKENTPASRSANVNIGIHHWQITNANIGFEDAAKSVRLIINNLNHDGQGDFNQKQFDISTMTAVDSLSVSYDGVEYLSNKSMSADVVVTVSDQYRRLVLKENNLVVNDFDLGFDGFLAFNQDDSIDVDVSYQAKQTTFKRLLSLVPGIYAANFNQLEATGDVAFSGGILGRYSRQSLPAFNLTLNIDQGMFTYPDLPTSLSNVSLDLRIDNQDGVIENTVVDLKQFQMDFGNSPIEGRGYLANLHNYDMDVAIRGELNMAEVSLLLPLEGLSARGNLSIDVKARGIYDPKVKQTPVIDAVMTMVDGQIKTAQPPTILDKINVTAKVINPTGKPEDFKAVFDNFSMALDGETFAANIELANLVNYTWKLNASGGVDLEKIYRLFHTGEVSLAGKAQVNLSSTGNIADLEAKRYHLLATRGDLLIGDLNYTAPGLPNISIASMETSFDLNKLSLEHLIGTIGNSDLAISGSVSNYMGYLFAENHVLTGSMQVSSNLLDVNELMSKERAVGDTSTPQGSIGIISIPHNIDVVMASKINTVALLDMPMTNVQGDVIVKDGVMQLNGVTFNLLAGAFHVNGIYDPRDLAKPKYDFKLNVDHVSANEAFNTIKVVQAYFPIAKNIDGNISSDLKVNGTLNSNMVPNMATLSGSGSLNIGDATLRNDSALQGFGTLMGSTLLSREQIAIRDMLMTFSIQNGTVNVAPFTVSLGGYQSTFSGTSSLNRELDFDMQMRVPAGKLGRQLNTLVSKYTGGGALTETTIIPLDIGIGGTFDAPSFTLKGVSTMTNVIKNVVKEQTQDMLGVDVNAEKAQQRQKLLDEAESQAGKITTEAKELAEKIRTQGYAQADKLIKEAGDNPLKKLIVDEAAKKLKREADNAANKVEAEAQIQAAAILTKAKKESEALQ